MQPAVSDEVGLNMKDPFKRALTHFSNKSQYVYPLAIVFSVVKTYDALRSTEISLEVKKWYESFRN